MPRTDNFVSFTCRLSRDSENLNLLEPKGPLLACVGFGIGNIIDKRRVDNVVKIGTVSEDMAESHICQSRDMVRRFDFLTTALIQLCLHGMRRCVPCLIGPSIFVDG